MSHKRLVVIDQNNKIDDLRVGDIVQFDKTKGKLVTINKNYHFN